MRRNDRDLRLVYGSALDRLLADNAFAGAHRPTRIGLNLHDSLNQQGKGDQSSMNTVEAALPRDLKLGLNDQSGLFDRCLDCLLAQKDISLPLTSWGTGTRRMAALEIASSVH